MRRAVTFLMLGLLFASAWGVYKSNDAPRGPTRKEVPAVQLSNQNMQNRVHRAGAIWLNITNYGFFGNDSRGSTGAMTDPEYPGTWAPQLEYPGGSGREYLFMGALWVGAMIQQNNTEFPRVSVGVDGWVNPSGRSRGEFFPGEGNQARIVERSTKLNAYNRLGEYVTDTTNAVSQQDFVCSYTDTLTETYYVVNDDIDGRHFPLGIKVTQKSYSWSYTYAQNFIIIDYEFENIASNYLKNLYVGMYMDADVGAITESERHTDDITGFVQYYYPPARSGIPYDSIRDRQVINAAWIADNDGRPPTVGSGSDFTAPDVFASRVLRAPNPRLKTSYNWWVSNGNTDLDYGPNWADARAEGGWPNSFSTPMGDKRKYLVLSNREFDFDQLQTNRADWIRANPQRDLDNPTITHAWKALEGRKLDQANDLANGFDTRYLLSWGPLGVFDHFDPSGNRIYRLNPGEKFWLTVALVMGNGFHDPNNPQIGNQSIDANKFRFDLLQRSAAQAARVYDNSMKDTKTRAYPSGDGWYGEDTGTDGLFAAHIGDHMIVDYVDHGQYTGPDADGTENNGRIDSLRQNDSEHPEFVGRTEDTHPWKPVRYDYTSGNEMLDAGDCEPDFLGPPPPPAPVCSVFTAKSSVIIRWRPKPSEDSAYTDPFSGLQDFEGYRLYVSNTGLESDFSFVKQWDRDDYGYYFEDGRLAEPPISADSANNPATPRVRQIDGNYVYLRVLGANTGFADIRKTRVVPGPSGGSITDVYYEYEIKDAAPLFPRYYSVTAYDYGDPKGNTESLETSKTATMFRTAPSGESSKPVGVAPNPYRVDEDYTASHSGGLKWENQDDGTSDFFPQQDRRIWFYNLPKQCLVRIFTVSGDLVAALPHNIAGDRNECINFDYARCWNLHNRNDQMVSSGLYLFSVEDWTAGNKGKMQTGKFVIIR